MPKRIRVNDLSPWPERVGCEGVIVDPPEYPGCIVYPWFGRGKDEVIILLHSDPLTRERHYRTDEDVWTCAIGRDCVDVLEESDG